MPKINPSWARRVSIGAGAAAVLLAACSDDGGNEEVGQGAYFRVLRRDVGESFDGLLGAQVLAVDRLVRTKNGLDGVGIHAGAAQPFLVDAVRLRGIPGDHDEWRQVLEDERSRRREAVAADATELVYQRSTAENDDSTVESWPAVTSVECVRSSRIVSLVRSICSCIRIS